MKYILFLLLFIPVGEAATVNYIDDTSVINYNIYGNTFNVENNPSGPITQINLATTSLHNYNILSTKILIELHYTAFIHQNTIGTWIISIEYNGQSCNIYVITSNTSTVGNDDLLVSSLSVPYCVFEIGSSNQIYINRTILSGNPTPPESETIAISVQKEDHIMTHQPEIALYLESIVFLLIAVFLNLVSKYHKSGLMLFMSGVCFIAQGIYGMALFEYEVIEIMLYILIGVIIAGIGVHKSTKGVI